MNDIEQSRLVDFKKILTYHIVSKICYSFNNNYDLYYKAPLLWKDWCNKKLKYNSQIYKCIIAFNQTALSSSQRQHIFGKDKSGKYVQYDKLIQDDNEITVFNKGTIFMNYRRFPLKKRYQLPYTYVKSIFDDSSLLTKVLNAKSDFYTNRQRRLIFTQIIGQKHYHYKTNKQLNNEALQQKSTNAIIEELLINYDLKI